MTTAPCKHDWARYGSGHAYPDATEVCVLCHEIRVIKEGLRPCDTALFGGNDARPIGGCGCPACIKARRALDVPPVCPNCEQWQHLRNHGKFVDCLNDCAERGFAPRFGGTL